MILPIDAQPPCAPYAEVQHQLADRYGEQRIGAGLTAGSRYIVEIYATPTGTTWTAIEVSPKGLACVVSAGTSWQVAKEGPGL